MRLLQAQQAWTRQVAPGQVPLARQLHLQPGAPTFCQLLSAFPWCHSASFSCSLFPHPCQLCADLLSDSLSSNLRSNAQHRLMHSTVAPRKAYIQASAKFSSSVGCRHILVRACRCYMSELTWPHPQPLLSLALQLYSRAASLSSGGNTTCC